MPPVDHPIHIVTTLHETRGNELHARELLLLLRKKHAAVTLWSDTPSPQVAKLGGKVISPFSGQLPKGGTLIILGSWVALDPWLDVAKPKRLIVICNTSNSTLLFSMLARLDRPGLPPVELVFISKRLQQTIGLPGRISPIIIDRTRYAPAEKSTGTFTVGRLSRDTPEKHHPDDAALYSMLAWHKAKVRIMGGTCLSSQITPHTHIELLPINAEPALGFLHSLDVFFYRTASDYQEAAGRVVMEALTCGLPVVAHVKGGFADWICPGENGFLFSAQEEAWEYLRKLQADSRLRHQMGKAAAASAEKWAGPAICENYSDWLLGR